MIPVNINKKLKSKYESQGLWGDRTLNDYWKESVARYYDKVFLTDERHTLTYGETDKRASALAMWMRSQGIALGDVISYQCTPRVEFVIITLACFKSGAVAAPIKMRTGESEWIRLMDLLESRMHFCMWEYHYKEMASTVENWSKELKLRDSIKKIFIGKSEIIREGLRYDDIPGVDGSGPEPALDQTGDWFKKDANSAAVVLFTSGTTRGSRGVVLTHNNIISSEVLFAKALGIGEEDCIFMPAPLSHATGFHHGIVNTFLTGGRLALMECYRPGRALEIMEELGCTYSMGATPFIFDYMNLMDQGAKKPGALKFFVCGGAPVPQHIVKKAFETYGLSVCECYGSTESVPHIVMPQEEAAEYMGRWSGKVIPGIEVKVVDGNRRKVGAGEEGEEVSRGPNLFSGYLGDAEATASVMDEDGWFYSGDLCYSDDVGHIKICGRKKDIIVRGGENLNINEIEDGLMECPGVEKVAACAMPDERLGERVCVFVVPKDARKPPTKDDLVSYMRKNKISKWLWPERVEYIDNIPYTESGKIQRYLLVKELLERMKSEGV